MYKKSLDFEMINFKVTLKAERFFIYCKAALKKFPVDV
jgi:hypothetical protein